MSRNYTSDQQLTDRLYFNDTEAFDELYRRYWFSLYSYSLKKLNSPEDAQKVVRDIFIDLWAKRTSWPLDFSVSQFFYTEVRKSVVKAINEKLLNDHHIEEELIVDFSTAALLQSKLPVKKEYINHTSAISQKNTTRSSQNKEGRPSTFFNVKWLRQTLVAKLN